MNIGQQIKKARKLKGLTQVQLAEKANISRSYLGDIEGNRYNPSVETLLAISNVLDIKMAYFFSDENEPANVKIDELSNLSKIVDLGSVLKKIMSLDRGKLIEFISYLDDLSTQ